MTPTTGDVPTYEIAQFRERASDACVVVFVINEGDRVRRQLARMQRTCAETDVIVADGGSTDGSLDDAESQGVTALLTKTGSGKLSAQMRMAFDYALRRGYTGVVVVDGNGKDDTAAVPRFIQALDDGYDHVQGSRYVHGGIAENTPRSRHLGVKFVHAPLISVAARRRYTDTTNGFRGYSRRLLEDPRVAPFRDVFQTYELHYYLAIRAARLGFRVTEIPVARRYPASGSMPTKISPIKGNLHVFRVLLRACTHRYNPREGTDG